MHWPIGLTPERLGFDEYFCADERERLAIETAALLVSRWTLHFFSGFSRAVQVLTDFRLVVLKTAGGARGLRKPAL